MTLSLGLLCVAAAAIVAAATSSLIGLGLILGRRALDAQSPAAQARLLLGLALLPLVVTVAVMAAALAPSFGWIADHCAAAGASHGHPHICVHHQSVLPALPIIAVAGLLLVRCIAVAGRLLLLRRSVVRTRRMLMREAQATIPGAHVLPLEAPQAFVLGVLRPAMFVTRGLLAAAHRDHMDTVLAHERAHLHRGDPARRLIASVAFAFHLPGIATAIERRLARAHEMAADEDAAAAVGSRARVARALVHLSRASTRVPAPALAFAGSDVELRVRSLLDAHPRGTGPGPHSLLAVASMAAVAIAVGADAVHHGLEVTLGLLGG